jgi:hypothetical protein
MRCFAFAAPQSEVIDVGMMKSKIFALAFAVTVLALSAAQAEDAKARPKAAAVPQTSGYKLDLNTALSPTSTPAPPPGASTLTRENNNPFLGLKLSKPLGG